MKDQLKQRMILIRNRWGLSNSVKRCRESTVSISGNMNGTTVRVRGRSTVVIPRGSLIRNAQIHVRGNDNRLEFGPGVKFSGKIELFGDGNTLQIGKDTKIAGADFIVHGGSTVEVGPACYISTQVDVRTTDSHSILDANGTRINPDKDVYIGAHVWLGRMVSVLKGARIHAGSMIGTMSLVTGTIPGNVIAAGVPAKPIRKGISWTKDKPGRDI
ncbi:Polysialic acid O-acetyltransferase [Neolewinella maritima]|uniref:Polysialic acid O-acetyltransferase n=1 Tax=Neolewinella maritima TaxID=1383882 RepID=A0ABM9AY08_9BACT|nr:hypothetical protein [Neolewinella maritima]CAH0999183.1 Polysialic acid O-acetyltransferase [Neolewinella maritima]